MDAREAAARVEGATDQHELLFALVAWWQLLRHSRIATLVDTLAAKLAVDRPPLDTSKRAHAEWLAVAKERDPVDIRRLVDAMWHAPHEQAAARLGPLAERDDPQVAPALLALLERDCHRWRNARALWDRVVAIAIDTRDVRMHDAIATALPHVGAALRSNTGDRLHAALEAARLRIPREDPVLDMFGEKLVGSLERELGVAPRPRKLDLDAILEEIYADPDADGPREVYADAIGGALGELIIRQLREPGPPLDITRAHHQQPLDEHVYDAIVGPLAGIAVNAYIVRGFAEQVAIWSRASAIRRHIGLPAWSLVTHVHYDARRDKDGHPKAVQLLSHPVVRRVHTLGGLPVQLLDNLAGTSLLANLRSLSIALADERTRDPTPELAGLAALRRLGFDGRRHRPPGWLERLDFAAGRFEELFVTTYDASQWLPALRALGVPLVTIEAGSSLLRFRGDALELDAPLGAHPVLSILETEPELLRGVARITLFERAEDHADLRAGVERIVRARGRRVAIDG